MKIVFSGLLSLSLALAGSAALAKGKKNAGDMDIEINHLPPSEGFLLTVPVQSLQGHLRHGDCLPGGIPGGDGGGDDDIIVASSDLEDAILAAIDKSGADIDFVDGCFGDSDDDDDDDGTDN